jgi:hypothetical protein
MKCVASPCGLSVQINLEGRTDRRHLATRALMASPGCAGFVHSLRSNFLQLLYFFFQAETPTKRPVPTGPPPSQSQRLPPAGPPPGGTGPSASVPTGLGSPITLSSRPDADLASGAYQQFALFGVPRWPHCVRACRRSDACSVGGTHAWSSVSCALYWWLRRFCIYTTTWRRRRVWCRPAGTRWGRLWRAEQPTPG